MVFQGQIYITWKVHTTTKSNPFIKTTEQSELSENIGLRLSLFYMNYHECII